MPWIIFFQRISVMDSETVLFQVLDYSQYFLDLTEANQLHEQRSTEVEEGEESVEGPEWSVLYNLTDYYGLHSGSAQQLHDLAEAFNTPDGLQLFVRWTQQWCCISSYIFIHSYTIEISIIIESDIIMYCHFIYVCKG